MPGRRSRARLSVTLISTSSADRSTTVSSGASFATLARSGHLHLAHLAVHRRSDIQAVDLALQVRDQELLAIEQRLLAVDIEVILLGLGIVVALGLLEGELRFLQGVLRLERLQFRVGTELVGLAAAIALALRRLLIDLAPGR